MKGAITSMSERKRAVRLTFGMVGKNIPTWQNRGCERKKGRELALAPHDHFLPSSIPDLEAWSLENSPRALHLDTLVPISEPDHTNLDPRPGCLSGLTFCAFRRSRSERILCALVQAKLV